jgi:hypothetical protein
MRKELGILVMVALFAVSATVAFAQKAEDIQKHPVCKYCNMDRQQYAHSRFLRQEPASYDLCPRPEGEDFPSARF